MTGTESAGVQQPGSSEVEQLSEKDQREASPLIDAFDLGLVCHYISVYQYYHHRISEQRRELLTDFVKFGE